MKFYKKYSLILYLFSVLIALFILIFSLIYTKSVTENSVKKDIETQYFNNIDEFSGMLKLLESNSKNRLTSAERTISDYIKTIAEIRINTSDSLKIEAILDQTGEKFITYIPKMFFGDTLLSSDKKTINKITYLTGAFVSIWQKNAGGYIRIISNETGEGANPLNKIFVHNSDPIIQTIERGEKFYTRQNIKFDTKYSVYAPVYINGFIRGIVQVTIFEKISSSLAKIYKTQNLPQNPKYFYIERNGNFLFNTGINEQFALSETFSHIKNNSQGSAEYILADNNGISENTVFYKKINSLNGYVCILVNKQEYAQKFASVKYKIYANQIIIILFFILILSIIFYYINKTEKKISEHLKQIVTGNYNPDKPVKILWFSMFINKYIQRIYDDIKEIRTVSEQLAKYGEQNIVELPEMKSISAKNFKKLHKNITNIISIHQKQRSENELREKLNRGTYEISAILQHNAELEELSGALLIKILSFLDMEMGAVFTVNTDNPEEPFLKMTANFAFGRQKLKNKIIKPDSGLIGRCYMEKQSIFLTEIPPDYTKIESGFGETEPKSVVIIPMIFNNSVQAVIELASINIIEQYKIEFLEKVGESIASTFASIDARLRTQRLLEQTQIQAKQIDTQRNELQEKIDTHRRQNRKLDKRLIEITEIINSIRLSAYVAEYDLNGTVVDVNERFLKLLGLKYDDIIGKAHSELIKDENYAQTYKTMWRDLKKGESEERTERIFVSEAEQYTFLNIYAPIRSSLGRIYRVLAIGSLLYEEYKK